MFDVFRCEHTFNTQAGGRFSIFYKVRRANYTVTVLVEVNGRQVLTAERASQRSD